MELLVLSRMDKILVENEIKKDPPGPDGAENIMVNELIGLIIMSNPLRNCIRHT